jgi:signal transduction histidine kinase
MLSDDVKFATLKDTLFFKDVPEYCLRDACKVIATKLLPAGHSIFRQGDVGNTMYIVAQGKLHIHNQETLLQELNPGDYFGELAALSPETRLASVSAVEDSILLAIDRETLYELIRNQFDFAKGIILALVNRARSISKMQQQLVLHEKFASLGLLSSGISHGIKNPLNFVINYSVLAGEGISELQERYRDNGELANKLTELNSIIGKIVDYSKRADHIVNRLTQQSHQKEVRVDSLLVSGLIQHAIEIVKQEFQASTPTLQVEVSLQCSPQTSGFKIYPFDLLRVFVNIIENSFYAMNQQRLRLHDLKPCLIITSKECEDGLHIDFVDNGGGISMADMKHLFEPFFTTKATSGGTGLGLFIANLVISQEHEGRIAITSDHSTETHVSIILPKIPLLPISI